MPKTAKAKNAANDAAKRATQAEQRAIAAANTAKAAAKQASKQASTAVVPRQAQNSGGRGVEKRDTNGPQHSIGWTKEQTQMIKYLMCMWASPDRVPPLRLGRMGGQTTCILPLNIKPKMQWNPNSAQIGAPSAQVGVGYQVNELWAVALHKNPRVALITLEWVTTQIFQIFGTNDAVGQWLWTAGTPLPVSFLQDLTGDPYLNGPLEDPPLYSSVDIQEGPGFWCDGTMPITATTSSSSKLTISSDGANFSASSYWYFEILVKAGEWTYLITTSVVGSGTTVMSLPLTMAGYTFVNYIGNSASPTGGPTTFTPIILGGYIASDTSGLIYYGPAQCTSGYASLGQWTVRHRPIPDGLQNVGDSQRINASNLICTEFAAPINAEGGIIGLEIPDGFVWCQYALPNNYEAGVAQWSSSVFNALVLEREAQVKSLGSGTDPGGSVFWHPNGIRDFEAEVEEQGFDYGDSNPDDTLVPLSDVTGGVMLCCYTATANATGRDGWWQANWHYEFRSQSQQFAAGLPQVDPMLIDEAAYRLTFVEGFAGNPSHTVQAIKRISGTVGRVAGPTAMVVGSAMMSNPVTMIPGAVTMGAGAIGTILGELLK